MLAIEALLVSVCVCVALMLVRECLRRARRAQRAALRDDAEADWRLVLARGACEETVLLLPVGARA